MSSGQRAAGRIFISHSSANSAIALAIVEAIETKGMACWYAPREVRFGEDWADELASALDHCASLVVLLSAESIKSPHVAKEVQQAASRRVPIFPARIENVTPTGKLAYYTSETQWCNAFGTGRDMAIENLVMALRARLSGETMPPTKIPKSLYDPPPAATSLLPPLSSDEALRLYVGPAAERYLVAWRRMARRKTSMDWKWPAFLVQGYWAGYRRMVLPGCLQRWYSALRWAYWAAFRQVRRRNPGAESLVSCCSFRRSGSVYSVSICIGGRPSAPSPGSTSRGPMQRWFVTS